MKKIQGSIFIFNNRKQYNPAYSIRQKNSTDPSYDNESRLVSSRLSFFRRREYINQPSFFIIKNIKLRTEKRIKKYH